MTTIQLVDVSGKRSDYATYDTNKTPPPFGHAVKPYWAFEPNYVNLNNGSYGSSPLPVLFKATELEMLAERNPDKFHRLAYLPLHRQSRERLADMIGTDTDEVVLVSNATLGINEVLRNFEWRDGDIILEATTTYGGISRTVRYLSDRSESPRPTAHAIEYIFPTSHAEIIDRFRAEIKKIKIKYANVEFSDIPPDSTAARKAEGVPQNKIVAVIDSLVASPGVLLPWKDLVKVCKEEGVWSVIDGAHSIGQEMDLNLREAKPDFFVSNCHKWLYAKRACALLYVPKRNQYIIKSSLPTSHGYVSPSDPDSAKAPNFVVQHEWTGTADLTPYLAVSAALDFRQWLGGEAAINAYCHDLAMKGGKRLAEVMGTRVMDETGELTLNMTNVLLPLPVEKYKGEVYTRDQLREIFNTLRHKLLFEWNTYAAQYFHAGGWWCRCSAQVWNELSDFEYIGKAFIAICEDIKKTVLAGKNGE